MKYKRGTMGRNLKKILSGILLVSMLSVAGCNKGESNEGKSNESVSVEDTKKEKKKDKILTAKTYNMY